MSDWIMFVLLALAILAAVGTAYLVLKRGRSTAFPEVRHEPVTRPAPEPEEVPRDRRPVDGSLSPEVVVEPERAAEPEAEPPSLAERLRKSRKFISDRLIDAVRGTPDEETWEDVEAALIQADVGVEVAERLVSRLKDRARDEKIKDAAGLKSLLAEEMVELFDRDRDRALSFSDEGPAVWLVVGVNGTGKTTTIGKLANDLGHRHRRVSLAAADTFRAAADEQLGVWAERAGAELIKHQPGADPGAVAHDAYAHAKAKDIDVLIVDTAGRLHTKTPLMDELAKIKRVIEKSGQVHESLLVIDATSGQNGLNQAKKFASSAGVTGVVLTKLDGTAKGGIAVAIEETLDIPIKLIGVGEGVDDLQPFDPAGFVEALLA